MTTSVHGIVSEWLQTQNFFVVQHNKHQDDECDMHVCCFNWHWLDKDWVQCKTVACADRSRIVNHSSDDKEKRKTTLRNLWDDSLWGTWSVNEWTNKRWNLSTCKQTRFSTNRASRPVNINSAHRTSQQSTRNDHCWCQLHASDLVHWGGLKQTVGNDMSLHPPILEE